MSSQTTQRLLWFGAGMSIGLALGLLFAPRSGSETRRLIGQRASSSRQALLETGREILARGRELYEKGRQIADEAADLFDEGRKLVEGAETYTYGSNTSSSDV